MSINRSPYPGLLPFGESDAAFFFGRNTEIKLLIANLQATALTVLYGASGCGKSSLLRAGVMDGLRADENVLAVTFSAWQDDPIPYLMASVVEAAREVASDFVPPAPNLTFSDSLVDVANRLDRRLLIILDQFEEYFSYHPAQSEFVAEFPVAVTQRDAPVNFMISIRDDSLAKLDLFEYHLPSLFDNLLRIEPLDVNAAREAIVGPIDRYNSIENPDQPFQVEESLVTALLNQVTAGRVILGDARRGAGFKNTESNRIETPFLQLVLTRLWQEELKIGSHVLRLKTLQDLGEAKSIVGTHLNTVMGELPKNEQEVAAKAFRYLVTPSGSKIAHTASDLASFTGLNESAVERTLEKLASGSVRILRTVAPSPGAQTVNRYEIFHDVLALAVLNWSTEYLKASEQAETKRQLAAQAIAQARAVAQHQRLKLFKLVLLLVVVFSVMMLALSTYAFKTRADARSAQAEALKQRDDATQQRLVAQSLSAEANKQREIALDQKREADKQRLIAEERRKLAEEQTRIATDMSELGGLYRDIFTNPGPGELGNEGGMWGEIRYFDLWKEVVSTYKRMGHTKGQYSTLVYIGDLYYDRAESDPDSEANSRWLQRALEFYDRALKLIGSSDPKMKYLTLIKAAELSDSAASIQYLKQTLPLLQSNARQLDDFHHLSYADTLKEIGGLYLDLKQGRQALPYLEEATNIYGREKNEFREIETMTAIVNAHVSLGDNRNTEGALKQALLLVHRGDRNAPWKANALVEFGTAYGSMGDKPNEAACLNEAVSIFENLIVSSSNLATLQAEFLCSAARVYARKEEKEKALAYFNRALALYKAEGKSDKVDEITNEINSLSQSLERPQ